MNVDLASRLYERELERREHLISAVSLPAGILAIVGGLLGAVATDFSYSVKILSPFFTVALIAAGLCFVWSLVFLVRAHVGHTYTYLANPEELRQFYVGTLAHYSDQPDPAAAAKVDFDDFLIRRYVAAADKNTNTNDRKSETLHQANRALATALVPALLCGILYAADKRVTSGPEPRTAIAGARAGASGH
jgi:hypothetical protein